MTAEELLGLGPETLQSILLYHVVPGVAALSTDLSNGLELPTALGETVTALVYTFPFSAVKIKAIGSTADVILPDIVACGAVIHVIDEVLLPFEVPEPVPVAPEPEPELEPEPEPEPEPVCPATVFDVRKRECDYSIQCNMSCTTTNIYTSSFVLMHMHDIDRIRLPRRHQALRHSLPLSLLRSRQISLLSFRIPTPCTQYDSLSLYCLVLPFDECEYSIRY